MPGGDGWSSVVWAAVSGKIKLIAGYNEVAVQQQISEETWDAIWDRYRVGLTTVAEISREFGVAESTIRAKASRDGWTQDLDAQVKAKAAQIEAKRDGAYKTAAIKREAALAKEAENVFIDDPNEQQIIEIVAERQVDIVFQERKDVAIARSVVTKLYEELSGQIAEGDKLDELMQQVDDLEDSTYNQKTHFKKKLEHTIGFSGRVDNCLKLVNALKNMIELERKVNKISDESTESGEKTKIDISFV